MECDIREGSNTEFFQQHNSLWDACGGQSDMTRHGVWKTSHSFVVEEAETLSPERGVEYCVDGSATRVEKALDSVASFA